MQLILVNIKLSTCAKKDKTFMPVVFPRNLSSSNELTLQSQGIDEFSKNVVLEKQYFNIIKTI
jgi:hypothetical protein